MPQYLVLSCLSGTSRDGLDIGLCRILQDGTAPEELRFRIELLQTATTAFPPAISRRLEECCFSVSTTVPEMMELHAGLGYFVGETLLAFMKQHGIVADQLCCVASHGQTLYHQARGSSAASARTLQIGEADIISRLTGVSVAADFRQAHIAAGGDGAPLAPVADYYAWRPGVGQPPRVMVNLGGIANITVLRSGTPLSGVVYGDTGPANILLDQAVQRFSSESGSRYDAGGNIARQGRVHEGWLQELLSHPFFAEKLPKSTGPEVFNLDRALSAGRSAGLSPETLPLPDVLATLTELSAVSLAEAIRAALPETAIPDAFGSGGGMRNEFLTKRIGYRLGLGHALPGIETLGSSSDFKEVALFALLGFFRQQRFRIPLFEGQPPVLLGKLSEV